MSGGVDSSVAAALLKTARLPDGSQGFNVVGAHLKCFNVDGCAAQDAEDARRAAEHLGIPFYTFDYEKEYKEKVVKYMIDGYKMGITPNPDVMCNKEIKFGLFYKKAMELGADFVATGHYVLKIATARGGVPPSKNLENGGGKNLKLKIAHDRAKDQSYFLWALKPEQLKHCLFPIGDYTKPQVRKLAKKFGLHNAEKKDSQGICFLGQVSLPDFLRRYIRPKVGAIINDSGKVIGQHKGAHLYTIGQRHLGLKNYELKIKNKPDQKPFYVAEKDVKKNTVVVVEGENHPMLYKKEVVLANLNLFTKKIPKTVFSRVRYRQSLSRAKIVGNKLIFEKPVKFVAEGQSAVFYDKSGRMLGGGIIL